MGGSTTWLSREVHALVTQWLNKVTGWEPFSADAARKVCSICVRYAGEFQLDETPHGMLHPLAEAVDDRVLGCFYSIGTERYGHLLELGWSFDVVDGIVRVVPPGISIFLDEDEVAAEAGDLRFDLTAVHSELLGIAVTSVRTRRAEIVRAASAAADLKVQALADQLIREICGP